MESQKTITIYDTPVESDEKLASLESSLDRPVDLVVRHKEESYIDSSMPSILLKNIIYNCIPIEAAVSNDTQPRVIGGSVDSIGRLKEPKMKKSKHLEISQSDPAKKVAPRKSNYILHVQFPTAILVFVQGKGFTVRAAGDTIAMIGILFDSGRSYIQAPYVFYTYRNTSIQNQSLQGILGLRSLVHRYKYPKVPRIANFYTHDMLSGEPLKEPRESRICDGFQRKRIAIRFLDDSDALYKIRCIQQFLLARELHYGLALSRTLQSLTAYTIAKLDFKSTMVQETMGPEKSQPAARSPEQDIILDILGISNKLAHDETFALATIYSSKFDDLYISLLCKAVDVDDIARQKLNSATGRSRRQILDRLKSKLISEKSSKAWRDAIARREFQKQLPELAPGELDVVSTTYDRELSHANALLVNKCVHNRLYKIVMASRETSFDTQKWLKLRELLDIPKISPATVDELPILGSMIPCGRCKFSALCPHNFIIFEYTDKLFSGDPQACMRYILDTMTSKQNLADGSYCNVCGELLQKISIESESWVNLAKPNESEPIDQIQLLILDEVAETMNANLDLSKSSINRSNLTQSIANSISPWIRRYELKLSRVKTNTELMIVFSLGLIIAIYTMMSLAHLIVLGPSGIAIKTITVRGETGLKLLHTLFNGIYKLLIAQRANVIEKIIVFTPDRIKKIMTRAYGKISGMPVTIETVTVQYHTDLITDNPYFHFFRNLWRIGELMQAGNARSIVPSKHGTVKSIIGVNIDEMMNLRDFFEKTILPDAWKTKNKPDAAWNDFCWKSCSQFASRLIAGTSALDSTNTKTITAEYNKNMEMRESIVKNADLLGENFSIGFRNLGRSQNFTSKLTYYEEPKDLTRAFCINGKAHDWKIYVLADTQQDDVSAENAKVTPSSRDYKASEFKSAEKPPGMFKTLKCIVCANTICGSAAESAQNIQLADVVVAFAKSRGLFAYYKIRCPEGSFHTFDDGKCSKCALSVSINGDEKNAFIEKYMPIYDSRNKPVNAEHTSAVIENMRREDMIIVHSDRAEAHHGKKPKSAWKPWISQNSAITTASKTWSQLPYNLLINISMCAQVHFATIVSGKANPSNKATDAEWLSQANTVAGYINTIVVSFNKLTVCATRGMHPDLTEACERQSDVIRGLVPVDLTNFNDEKMWRQENDKPSGYANWMINRLCETLLEINNRSNAVATRFVEIMADMIAESELNMSKSVVYKNIMIAASKNTLGLDTAGDEIEAPETDAEAKEFIKSIVDEGENFGSGDVDVDDFAASRGDDDI